MKKIAKYVIGAGIVLGSVTGSYFVGQNQGFDKGYSTGRQNAVEKLEKVADIEIDNCEHNIKVYNESMWNSTPEQIKGLEGLAKHELDKRNTLKSVVGTVKAKNISVNGSAF